VRQLPEICVVTWSVFRYSNFVLPEKHWKLDSLLRLGMGIFICQILGLVVLSVIQIVFGGLRSSLWLFCLATIGSFVCCAASIFLLRKPWVWEGFKLRFALLLATVYVALTLGMLAQYSVHRPDSTDPVWRIVTAALFFQGAVVVLSARFVAEHKMRWPEAFGFGNDWPHALFFGVLLAVVFVPVGVGLQLASAYFMTRVHVEPVEQQAVQTLRESAGWLNRALLGVVAVGLAPIAEEVLFRGILYPAVKQAGFRRMALWGTSVLFAVIHGNLAAFLPLLVLSVVLTLLYENTNNLLAPIVAHAIFNGMNFLRLFLGDWFAG